MGGICHPYHWQTLRKPYGELLDNRRFSIMNQDFEMISGRIREEDL